MTDPSTIRRQALEEARAVACRYPALITGDDSWRSGYRTARYHVTRDIQSLLAADPREASAPIYADPIDPSKVPPPGRYRNPEPTPAKTYHDGVRDALAALPERVTTTWDGVQWLRRSEVVDAISALLPQPKDEAEEIVERWEDYAEEQTGLVPVREMQDGAASMLRWLLSQGWRAPE